MPDEILTLPEVAQLLKVAEETVYTMAKRREISAFMVRGQWRFKRADLDQWIESQRTVQYEAGFGSAPSPSDVICRASRKRNDH
jgi:excisionase family DNA binding protein